MIKQKAKNKDKHVTLLLPHHIQGMRTISIRRNDISN